MTALFIILRTSITCFLFLIVALGSYAQEAKPSFVNYSTLDGLPSSEVYCGLQDRQGFLWFSTDRGVVRYNGYEFTNFTVRDGLTDNVVFELIEDYKGRIWMLSSNGRLCYFASGKITEYQFNNVIAENIQSDVFQFNAFHVDSSDNVHIATINNGLLKISRDGTFNLTKTADREVDLFTNDIGQLMGHSSAKAGKPHTVQYENNSIFNIEASPIRVKAFFTSEDLICVNSARSIVLYDNSKGKLLDEISFSSRVTSFIQADDLILVGLELGGLKVYSIKSQKFHIELSALDNFTVSTPFKDRDGGYWIPTIESGIFYTPSFDILSYTESNGLTKNYIKELRLFNDELMISFGDEYQTLTNKVMALENSVKFSTIPKTNSPTRFIIKDCHILLPKGELVDVCTSRIFPYRRSGMRYIEIWNDTTFIFSKGDAYQYSSEKIEKVSSVKDLPQIEDVVILDHTSFWIGTIKGLYKIESGKKIQMKQVDERFSQRIVDLDITDNYGLVVATRTGGILLYKDEKLTQLSTLNGLISNDIICLSVDEYQNIWVGTNKGLHKIDSKDYRKITYYSTLDGLISNEITDVERLDDKVYVGTKKGLSVIDLHTFKKRDKNNINIVMSGVKLDGQNLENHAIVDVYPDDSFLEISYLGLSYYAQGNIEYKYRILGLSNEWHYTRDHSLILENFPESGQYVIEVYTRIPPDGEWNKTPIRIEVNFHPPFYKTWTFIIGVIILIALLVYLAFRFNLLAYNRHIQQELTNRLMKRLGKKSYLIIESDRNKIRINEAHILFIQSFKDYAEINTVEKKHLTRSTMKKMESRLTQSSFIRVHRSFIVRKDKIDSISKNELEINNVKIPIGRTYQESVNSIRQHYTRLNN